MQDSNMLRPFAQPRAMLCLASHVNNGHMPLLHCVVNGSLLMTLYNLTYFAAGVASGFSAELQVCASEAASLGHASYCLLLVRVPQLQSPSSAWLPCACIPVHL